MPGLRGLTVIAADGDAARFAAAIELVASWAALGGGARLFCRGGSVQRLNDPALAEAMSCDVQVIACQSALAEHAIDLSTHDPRIEAGGMVSLLATLGEDRLVVL